jgi:hypothetical protein
MSWGRSNAEVQRAIDQSSGGTPGIWDVVYFGGKPCQGIAKVSLNLGADIDKRRKKGQKKSRAVDCGAKPAELEIELTLRPSEIDGFVSDFVPLLFSLSKTSAQNPIAVGHPSLEIWGLDLFVVQSLSQPHPSGGFLKLSIKATEWSPEPKVISTKQIVVSDKVKEVAGAILNLASPGAGGNANVRNAIDKLF